MELIVTLIIEYINMAALRSRLLYDNRQLVYLYVEKREGAYLRHYPDECHGGVVAVDHVTIEWADLVVFNGYTTRLAQERE